tara:strand:+ start:102 stop:629 length:528 start_codon:yes stop_codon:yes gene_type:complete
LKLQKTNIKGVYVVHNTPFSDERGSFTRLFCRKEFKEKIKFEVKQSNLSINQKKYTLRGFHYQTGKSSENKILKCIKGKIFDIIVDLRKKSKTYKKYISITLDDKNNNSIILPKGCANAFLTLSNDTIVLYYTDNYYNKNFEKGIRFNDPSFKFKWPVKPKIISKKDQNYKNFKI